MHGASDQIDFVLYNMQRNILCQELLFKINKLPGNSKTYCNAFVIHMNCYELYESFFNILWRDIFILRTRMEYLLFDCASELNKTQNRCKSANANQHRLDACEYILFLEKNWQTFQLGIS